MALIEICHIGYWIYYSSRKSSVGMRGRFTAWRDVLSGGPQGSVLGPLLFLIFVNDLLDWIKCCIQTFADDTKIWTKINTSRIAKGCRQSWKRWRSGLTTGH